MIKAVGAFPLDVGRLEKVDLDGSTYVALVAEDAAVVVERLDNLEVVYVMPAGLGEVIRVYHSAQAAEGVQFVAEIVDTLRGAVAEVGGKLRGALSHLAAFASREATDLHGLAVDAEVVLPTVHCQGHPLTDFLAKSRSEIAAVVVLAARDEVGQVRRKAFQHDKQAVLAVNAFCFSCD